MDYLARISLIVLDLVILWEYFGTWKCIPAVIVLVLLIGFSIYEEHNAD